MWPLTSSWTSAEITLFRRDGCRFTSDCCSQSVCLVIWFSAAEWTGAPSLNWCSRIWPDVCVCVCIYFIYFFEVHRCNYHKKNLPFIWGVLSRCVIPPRDRCWKTKPWPETCLDEAQKLSDRLTNTWRTSAFTGFVVVLQQILRFCCWSRWQICAWMHVRQVSSGCGIFLVLLQKQRQCLILTSATVHQRTPKEPESDDVFWMKPHIFSSKFMQIADHFVNWYFSELISNLLQFCCIRLCLFSFRFIRNDENESHQITQL